MEVLNIPVTRSGPLVFNSGRRFRLLVPKPNVYHSSKSQASTGFSETHRTIKLPLSQTAPFHFGGRGISFPGFEKSTPFASFQINRNENTFALKSHEGTEISIGDFLAADSFVFSLNALLRSELALSARAGGYEYDFKMSVVGEKLVLCLQEYTSFWNDSEKLKQLKGVDTTLAKNNFTADQIKAWKLFAQVSEFWDFPIKLHSFQKEPLDGLIHDAQIVEKLLSQDFMPVIGDMHANSRKALAFLVLTGRLRMSSIDVAKIIGIFHELENISLRAPFDINSINAQIEEITNEDYKIDFTKLKLEDSDPLVVQIKEYRKQIKEILDRAEWKGGKVLFLGDVISDRWGFDFPMMDLIERFKDNLIVLLSNHDVIGARLLTENNLYDPEKPKQQVSTLRDLMVFPLADLMLQIQNQLLLRKLALVATEARILFTHAPVNEQVLQTLFSSWARSQDTPPYKEIEPENINLLAGLFEKVGKWYEGLVAEPIKWESLWSAEFTEFVGARPGDRQQYPLDQFPFGYHLQQIVCGHHTYREQIREVTSLDQHIGRQYSEHGYYVNSIFLLSPKGLQSVSQSGKVSSSLKLNKGFAFSIKVSSDKPSKGSLRNLE